MSFVYFSNYFYHDNDNEGCEHNSNTHWLLFKSQLRLSDIHVLFYQILDISYQVALLSPFYRSRD